MHNVLGLLNQTHDPQARVIFALVLVALLQSIMFGVSTLSLSTAIARVAVVCGAQRLRYDAAALAFDARELAVGPSPWTAARLRGEVAGARSGRNFVRFGPAPSGLYLALFPGDAALVGAMDALHFGATPDAYVAAGRGAAPADASLENGLDTFLLTYAGVAEGIARAPRALGANATALSADARVAYLMSSLPALDARLAASAALYMTQVRSHACLFVTVTLNVPMPARRRQTSRGRRAPLTTRARAPSARFSPRCTFWYSMRIDSTLRGLDSGRLSNCAWAWWQVFRRSVRTLELEGRRTQDLLGVLPPETHRTVIASHRLKEFLRDGM